MGSGFFYRFPFAAGIAAFFKIRAGLPIGTFKKSIAALFPALTGAAVWVLARIVAAKLKP